MRRVRRRIDPVRLSVFEELFKSLTEDMGEVLRQTAPSVNVRERRDYSCALYDAGGRLVGQAAHIPVHLGSAELSVQAVRRRFPDLGDREAVLLNDPYAGGTHLPDLTLVTAVRPARGEAPWFVVNRAHHADVGGAAPGSMAPAADLPAEGFRIPPVRLAAGRRFHDEVLELVLANTRTPRERLGDLKAQLEANLFGAERLVELAGRHGVPLLRAAADALRAHARRLFRAFARGLAPGRHAAETFVEDAGGRPLGLRLSLEVPRRGPLVFDFRASDPQDEGCLNANPAVVRAAVLYALAALLGRGLPVQGLGPGELRILTAPGTLLDARFPAAVAGGNVETSQRLVDLSFRAFAAAGAEVPAESAGTMNNLSFGGRAGGSGFTYYETLGGGAGASRLGPGASAVQTHMTNTKNTPVEELELRLPVLVERLAVRRRSGGGGRHRGGDGLIKVFRALAPLSVSLLADRRRLRPAGAAGGAPGAPGRQFLIRGGRRRALPAKGSFVLAPGDRFEIQTPGGGGYGRR